MDGISRGVLLRLGQSKELRPKVCYYCIYLMHLSCLRFVIILFFLIISLYCVDFTKNTWILFDIIKYNLEKYLMIF